MTDHVPYCGAPPAPYELWTRWNLDPVLIAALAAVALCYGLGAGRAGLSARSRAAFYSGWAVVALALLSPLCSLSVALFAARIGQHMIIALVGVPLVALGRPCAALRALRGLPPDVRSGTTPAAGVMAGVAFAVALWLWHTPYFYGATFRSDFVYWTMHVTMIAAALLLWRALLGDVGRLGEGGGSAVAAGVGIATSVQMGLLGAILTFAPRPLFAEHFLTTAAWGLSPIADQQLGGALMWAPGSIIFVIAGALSLARLFGETAADARR